MPTKARQPATLKDELTGLDIVAIDDDSKKLRLDIKNETHAAKAIEVYSDNEEKIAKLKRKLAPLEAEREMIRAGMREFQERKGIDDFEFGKWVSQLISRTASRWIFTQADIPANVDLTELDSEPVPMMDILEKKFGDDKKSIRKIVNKMTVRVINPNGIDEVVKSGAMTAQEIEPAMLQYTDTSYVQIKEKK